MSFSLVKETTELIKQIKFLNSNIKILAKVVSISIGKEEIFKDKETKEAKIDYLDKMGIPRSLIALMIGSTPGSVSALKCMSKGSKKEKSSE